VPEGLRPLPVTEPAPAKLNLFLRVLGRRTDGYHDIETLVQPVTLADGVRAAHREEGFGLTLAAELAAVVPDGEENLVLRAARALAEATGERRGANLLLVKRIPVAAGLGGGSADAAAALRALDRLWGWGLGPERLAEIGAGLGSDVPALVHGGPRLARGRGERVEPVPVPRTWWVLKTFDRGVATAEAYRWWDEDGSRTGPDPGPLVDALGAGDLQRAGPLLSNDLEGPVMTRRAEVEEARRRLLESGAVAALLCGSGPTVAGLARDAGHAEQVAAASEGLVVSAITRPPA
jgi:4-diphosphocytidyl-2-C-methyl-D-erythritol kinase